MKVVGVCGKIGSGKDTFAGYLVRKHEFQKVVMSDIIVQELKKNDMEINRENMQKLSKEYKLKYGKGIWAKSSIDYARRSSMRKVVISGIRDTEEVKIFRELLGKDFILVYVKTNPEIRFKRLMQRKGPKDPKTMKDLEEQEQKEAEIYDLYDKFEETADHVVENNRMVVELYALAEEFIKKFRI